jgi:hypothetical protein
MVAMLYAQLSGASSLRVLELSFNSHQIHHRVSDASVVRRSTLADANERRVGEVFDDTAAWLITQVSRKLRQESSELMCLLDPTSITLKGREFDCWTLNNCTRNTQGIKLHILLDAATRIPAWYRFSAPNINDVEQAHHVPLQPDGLYVFDKGYCDFNWWKRIDASGAHFVTRFKNNAALIAQNPQYIPADEQETILSDEIVRCKRKYVGKYRVNSYDKPLRRIVVLRPDKPMTLVLATNDLDAKASDIAQHYKERWAIELFFKWLKQHLKIKSFFGRSANAVHYQIVIALISHLLIALYRQTHRLSCTLWETLSPIRANLFEPAVTETTLDLTRLRRSTTPALPKCYS